MDRASFTEVDPAKFFPDDEDDAVIAALKMFRLWDVVSYARVSMNDHKSYCAIRLDENSRSRKRVCLLRFNDLSKLEISLFDKIPSGQGEIVSISEVGEINNYAERIRERARQILSSEK